MPSIAKYLLAAALVSATGAQAAQPRYYEDYFGLGTGLAKARNSCNSASAVNFAGTCDDSDTSFRIFGAHKVQQHFGIELGYTNFGKTRTVGTLSGTAISGERDGYAVGLSAVGFLPLGNAFELHAKAGVARWDLKADRFFSTAANVTDAGFAPTAGIGVTWFFMPQGGLRLEYQRFQKVGDAATVGEFNFDDLSLNLVLRF